MLYKLALKQKKIKVNYCPVFLAGLHRTADITPAGLHPQKAKHMIKDLKMCADWYKIKYQFNRYFPVKTIHIMRGSIVLCFSNIRKLPFKPFKLV